MSLSRNVFHDFRHLFRLFDEVSLMRPSYPTLNRYHFDDFNFPRLRHPSVDVSEHGNEYVVEADLPGVKKEHLEVRIGDQGRSLTIEGQVHSRSPSGESVLPPPTATPNTQDAQDSKQGEQPPPFTGYSTISGSLPLPAAPSATDSPTQSSSERPFVGTSHFTRTVWLPRPVDTSKVTGNLEDGILTLRIPKSAEQDSIRVNIQ